MVIDRVGLTLDLSPTNQPMTWRDEFHPIKCELTYRTRIKPSSLSGFRLSKRESHQYCNSYYNFYREPLLDFPPRFQRALLRMYDFYWLTNNCRVFYNKHIPILWIFFIQSSSKLTKLYIVFYIKYCWVPLMEKPARHSRYERGTPRSTETGVVTFLWFSLNYCHVRTTNNVTWHQKGQFRLEII